MRRNILLWVGLVLVLAYCLGLFTILPMSSTWRAFWIGFAVAATLAAFAWMVESLSNTRWLSLGKLGEEATAEAVLSWRQRRKGWRLVNGLVLDASGDIDHVVVGPGGVFAIESKWTSKPCHIEQGRVKGLVGREPVSQARTGARNVERLLLRHGLPHVDATVRPVVVLWGPGRVRLDHGWSEVNGVLVCDGPGKKLWLKKLAGQVIGRTEVEAIANVLEERVTSQIDPPIQSVHSKPSPKSLRI
jgi:hypothetical protein